MHSPNYRIPHNPWEYLIKNRCNVVSNATIVVEGCQGVSIDGTHVKPLSRT